MKKDIFYKWHKSNLKKHTTEVDVDAIWAAIEPEVDVINADNKKRRRFFFFLYSLSALIVFTGFISLFFSGQTPTTQHIISSNNINEIQDKEGTQIAESTIETKSLDQIAHSSSIEFSEKKVDKRNTFPPSTIFSPSSNLKNDDNNEKIRRHSPQISTSQVYLGEETSNSIVKPIVSINTVQKAVTSTIILNDSSSNQESDVLEQERIIIPISDQLPNSDLTSLIADEDDLPSLKVQTKKGPKFQFSVGAYSGLAFANRNLDVKEGFDENELLDLRETTERSLEVWNNGIKTKLAHKSGFYVNVGLQYSRVAENFQYDNDHLKEDSIANQIIGMSNNLLGDRSNIIGYAPNDTLFALEYDFYNNYHFIDIPISIGYQKHYKLWNFGLRAGVVYNLSLRTKGRILANEYSAINIGSETISPFRSQVPLSYESGLNIGYRLTPKIELGLEAYYRFLPNSITIDNYSISQKYSWTGLNASINYLF